jgi:hypothetical protein
MAKETGVTPKPPRAPLPPLEPHTDALRELASKARWVCWRYEWVKDKWTKVPYQSNGQRASTTDPATWTTYDLAVSAALSGAFDGVGRVVYRGDKDGEEPDDFVGVDLDHCITPETNVVSLEADEILVELDTYAETTPSGEGLRAYVRGTLPVDGAKKNGLEVYQHGRYFTVTGAHVDWCPSEIRDGQAALDALYLRVFGEPTPKTEPKPARPVALTDSEILSLMFGSQDGEELRALYDGSEGVYGSASEADLRLCGALAFWTGRDVARMDRLFQGSGRMRDKWGERHRGDGATYGRMTIEEAIEGCADVYEPEAPAARVRLGSARPVDEEPEPPRAHSPTRPWPSPMGEAAFVGLAGETVRALEPYTEADPHGLLVSTLTAFGCMLNAGPYLLHGSTAHWPRLFALAVGSTGDGRKGESWTPVRRLVLAAEKTFGPRIQGGLSSGEGLISAVRDETHGVVKGEVVVVDEGIEDKRLLVFEAEFGRVLVVLNRETNTLGSIVRDAWDTGDLTVLTKTPYRATGAHIAIIGHVTPEELVGKCDQAWITNGFLNRFLVVMVRRARLIPIPKAFDGEDLAHLTRKWADALERARRLGRLGWSPEARAWWEGKYAGFLTTEGGKLGAMKARAAPMVLRLTLAYQVMDGSKNLAPVYLEAAEEVWRYCERSVEYLFGESTGDATADVILRYLRSRLEMNKTDIHKLFNRNKEAHELDTALDVLAQAGLAFRKYSAPKEGKGRIETWFLQE